MDTDAAHCMVVDTGLRPDTDTNDPNYNNLFLMATEVVTLQATVNEATNSLRHAAYDSLTQLDRGYRPADNLTDYAHRADQAAAQLATARDAFRLMTDAQLANRR